MKKEEKKPITHYAMREQPALSKLLLKWLGNTSKMHHTTMVFATCEALAGHSTIPKLPVLNLPTTNVIKTSDATAVAIRLKAMKTMHAFAVDDYALQALAKLFRFQARGQQGALQLLTAARDGDRLAWQDSVKEKIKTAATKQDRVGYVGLLAVYGQYQSLDSLLNTIYTECRTSEDPQLRQFSNTSPHSFKRRIHTLLKNEAALPEPLVEAIAPHVPDQLGDTINEIMVSKYRRAVPGNVVSHPSISAPKGFGRPSTLAPQWGQRR